LNVPPPLFTIRTMTDALLPLLRCPATRQALRRMTAEEKELRAIPVDEPALVTMDGSRVYRAVNGMPILLPPAIAEEEVSVG
jgi:uncharacterized protein YbaR (Trm112 family)